MTSERANKSIRCHLIAAMLSEKPVSRNTAGALKSERAVPAAGAASLLGVSEGLFGGFGVLLARCCPWAPSLRAALSFCCVFFSPPL